MKTFNHPLKKTIVLVLSIAFIYSCKPKDPTPAAPSQLDASTGKSVANSSNASTGIAVSAIQSNAGVAAIRSFNSTGAISTGSGIFPSGSLRTAETSAPQDILSVTKLVVGQIGKQSEGRIAPDFEASKGIWEYNFTTKQITKTAAASEIIIKFPDSTNLAQNTGINNCTYTIHQLTTQFYVNTSIAKTDTLITHLNADLYVSGTKALDLDFSSTYTNNTISKADYVYHVGDYSITFNYSQKSILQVYPYLNYSVSKSGSSVYSYTISPTYIGDSLNTLDYSVSVGDVKFTSSYQFNSYFKDYLKNGNKPITQYATDTLITSHYESGTLNQISTGAKIGDLKYLRSKLSTAGGCNTCYGFYFRSKRVIVYSDGTYEDLSNIFSSLKTSILQYYLFSNVY